MPAITQSPYLASICLTLPGRTCPASSCQSRHTCHILTEHTKSYLALPRLPNLAVITLANANTPRLPNLALPNQTLKAIPRLPCPTQSYHALPYLAQPAVPRPYRTNHNSPSLPYLFDLIRAPRPAFLNPVLAKPD